MARGRALAGDTRQGLRSFGQQFLRDGIHYRLGGGRVRGRDCNVHEHEVKREAKNAYASKHLRTPFLTRSTGEKLQKKQ